MHFQCGTQGLFTKNIAETMTILVLTGKLLDVTEIVRTVGIQSGLNIFSPFNIIYKLRHVVYRFFRCVLLKRFIFFFHMPNQDYYKNICASQIPISHHSLTHLFSFLLSKWVIESVYDRSELSTLPELDD